MLLNPLVVTLSAQMCYTVNMRIHNSPTRADSVIPGLLVIHDGELRETKNVKTHDHGRTLIEFWDGNEWLLDDDQKIIYVKVIL